MERVRVTAHGGDGAVEVTIDSTGGLVDLHLTEAGLRLGAAALAAEILATARRAQAQLPEVMSQTMASVLGPGSDTARFVTETYAERFPAPPDDADERTRR
jgi:DNA-binding protein YbaB